MGNSGIYGQKAEVLVELRKRSIPLFDKVRTHLMDVGRFVKQDTIQGLPGFDDAGQVYERDIVVFTVDA